MVEGVRTEPSGSRRDNKSDGKALPMWSMIYGPQPWRGVPASCNAPAPYPCETHRMPLRCLLVDDNDAFLKAASVLLEREGVTVVGEASSITEAQRKARMLRPDVILVDVGLREENGFDLAQVLAGDGQADGDAKVIMISARCETDYAELVAESPAAGFLAKSELSARGIGRILNGTA